MGFVQQRLSAWSVAVMTVVGGLALGVSAALAGSPALVVDVGTGDVLYQDNATTPWFPASTTKLMTVYVALSAVREGRITLDTPLMVSPRAATMQPSKMGFKPGTLVTLDNALKMLMVKSPNDIAVTIAEGVSGSVESFANEMNLYATRIGLHESHFENPNGLPDPRHVSSARDMALIATALLRDFPEERGLFGIGVLAFGSQRINNHNGLLGRYPGVDGMKTGFTCAAGYNVVESAERGGRRLVVVIMGAPSTAERNTRAAALFDRFFAGGGSSLGSLAALPASSITEPPDNHQIACGRGRAGAIAEAETEDSQLGAPGQSSSLSTTRVAFEPVRVFIGPVAGWNGRIAQATDAGAREYASAPVKRPFPGVAAASGSDAGAPVESAAPGPMPLALVGASAVSPAAAATGSLVKAAPGMGLAVPARKGRLARHRFIAPVKATLAKPSLLAKEEAAEPPKPTAKLNPRTGGKLSAKPTKGARQAAAKPVPAARPHDVAKPKKGTAAAK